MTKLNTNERYNSSFLKSFGQIRSSLTLPCEDLLNADHRHP